MKEVTFMDKTTAIKQLDSMARSLSKVAEAFNQVDELIDPSHEMSSHHPVPQGGELGSQNPDQPTLFDEQHFTEDDCLIHYNDMYFDGVVSPVGDLLIRIGNAIKDSENLHENRSSEQVEADTLKAIIGAARIEAKDYFSQYGEDGEVTLSPSADWPIQKALLQLMTNILGR
jgi:hypothetical protein